MTGTWSGYLTKAEAATEARLSPRAIQRGLHDARRPLKHHRVGRRVIIARADLRAWIEAHAGTLAPTPAALQERVLARVSPLARELLDGILSTPAAPNAPNTVNSHD